jgi:hypothetical protein
MTFKHIHAPTCFLTLSLFLHSSFPPHIDLIGLGVPSGMNADIMPTNTRSGNSLLALDLNIKQRARLLLIEILVDT